MFIYFLNFLLQFFSDVWILRSFISLVSQTAHLSSIHYPRHAIILNRIQAMHGIYWQSNSDNYINRPRAPLELTEIDTTTHHENHEPWLQVGALEVSQRFQPPCSPVCTLFTSFLRFDRFPGVLIHFTAEKSIGQSTSIITTRSRCPIISTCTCTLASNA